MSLKKFGKSDVIRNAMRSAPESSFLIYSGNVFYNENPIESGSFSDDVIGAAGGISLFEYNIDKDGTTEFISPSDEDALSSLTITGPNAPIVPYIINGSSRTYIKNTPRTYAHVSASTTARAGMPFGSVLTGSSYSMTSSIERELMTTAGARGASPDRTPTYRHYYGLKSSLNFYATRSPHYAVTGGAGGSSWNKDTQDINMVSVPKIFYGTRIRPGTIDLKFYITGTLVGQLKDEKQNGELIQVGPSGSAYSGSVAGVALYDEGIFLMTGSWDLTSGVSYDFDGSSHTGSWLRFAHGANDSTSPTNDSASFGFDFKGHTETQVLTMYAHARRGEVNFSNNPTFIESGSAQVAQTSSNLFIENDQRIVKNTVSSSFASHSASFERQVYISKVAIYDKDKKLIGVASLASPVLKKEGQDLSFKLKMDL